MPKLHGFTLPEIMIALCGMTILATIAITNYSSLIHATHSKLLRTQLLTAIANAKQFSQMQQQAVVLCQTLDNKSCSGSWENGQMIFVNENEDGKVKKTKDILHIFSHKKMSGKLYWRSFPFYHPYILFKPNAHNDNGTFWYCETNKPFPAWAVTVSKTGIAREKFPNASGKILDAHSKALGC